MQKYAKFMSLTLCKLQIVKNVFIKFVKKLIPSHEFILVNIVVDRLIVFFPINAWTQLLDFS